MKKFKVIMKRTYVTTTEVEVEAKNKNEAYNDVYNNLADVDIYRLEDNNLAEMESEVFNVEEVDIYKMENTYLVYQKSSHEYVRWNFDNSLFFAGSKEDAILGLQKDKFEVERVCDAPAHAKKEYMKLIDEKIKNGEL